VLHCNDYKDAQCKNEPYFGAVVGRVANRIANAKFDLNGKVYELPANNGPNCLHGGTVGFSHLNFESEQVSDNSVKFTLKSKDGDQGFPGSVIIKVLYTLEAVQDDAAELSVLMTASLLDASDGFPDDEDNVLLSTPINLAQHSYFNLAGHDCENGILDHSLTLKSKEYTPTDANSIPTREVRSLDKEPAMDFRTDRELFRALSDFGQAYCDYTHDEAKDHIKKMHGLDKGGNPYGFDHNYVLNPDPTAVDDHDGVNEVAILSHPPSGRTMRLFTDAPGLQVYTANYMDGVVGKDCMEYKQWQGIALETQHYPDSIGDVSGEFAKGACVILEPGSGKNNYAHRVKYQFGGL